MRPAGTPGPLQVLEKYFLACLAATKPKGLTPPSASSPARNKAKAGPFPASNLLISLQVPDLHLREMYGWASMHLILIQCFYRDMRDYVSSLHMHANVQLRNYKQECVMQTDEPPAELAEDKYLFKLLAHF